MVRFAHAFLFYMAMVMTGLMLFFSSCHAVQQQLPPDSNMFALAKNDALVASHQHTNSPPP